VAAVDNQGRRSSTRPVALTTDRFQTQSLTTSPGNGLERALAALRRGHVTVRLAPGQYRLSDVRIGDGARLVGSGPRTVITAPSASYFRAHRRGRTSRLNSHRRRRWGPGRGIAVAVFDNSETCS
jgi:hypothetical protein